MLKTLVVVFLRGGADGLTLVPPIGDDDYHRARPGLAVAARDAIRLDCLFGLNPRLTKLEPFFREGRLTVVPACGSDDNTRSHFEAQDLMEHGGHDAAGGWLGRWLRQRAAEGCGALCVEDDGGGGALSAIALGTAVPESLRGAPAATALQSLADLGLGPGGDALRGPLARLYAGDAMLGDAARDALQALDRLAGLRESDYRPEHGAAYASDDFAAALKRIAQLLKTGAAVDAACVDLGGWDTHFLQERALDPLMTRLASGLAAFATDLGPRLASTSIVVMTEFGRRLRENASLGTDHGRGGAMFVLGGGTSGGVHGRWPGLDNSVLDGPGDVAVAQDYRGVLSAVLARHGQTAMTGSVFPGFDGTTLPV